MLSISLQVSEAICLIMNYWGNVKEKVFITYYAGGEMAKAQDNDMVLLKKERLQSCAKDIYTNRFFINLHYFRLWYRTVWKYSRYR